MMDTINLGLRDWSEDRHICHFIGAGTATLLGAGIQGGSALAGGKKGASAATQAAQIQAQAAMAALGFQEQVHQQNVQNLQPFIDYGTGGIDQLRNFVSGPGATPIDTTLPQFTFQPTQAQLAQTPGYQFTRQAALDAEQANLLTQGRLGSATAQGAAITAGNIADTTWQQVYNQQQNTYQTNVNSLLQGRTMDLQQRAQINNILQGRVNTGTNAAAVEAGTNQAFATGAGQAVQTAGAAQAGGVVGAANALQGVTNTIGNIGGGLSNFGLQQLALSNALGGTGGGFNTPVIRSDAGSAAINAQVDALANA
jgi:hypothetical protein